MEDDIGIVIGDTLQPPQGTGNGGVLIIKGSQGFGAYAFDVEGVEIFVSEKGSGERGGNVRGDPHPSGVSVFQASPGTPEINQEQVSGIG